MGTTVRVPIPNVSKKRRDIPNILAVLMSVTEDGFYDLELLKEFKNKNMRYYNPLYAEITSMTMKYPSGQLELLCPMEAAKDLLNVFVKQNALSGCFSYFN